MHTESFNIISRKLVSGAEGRPAPKLKEAADRMSEKQMEDAYNQVMWSINYQYLYFAHPYSSNSSEGCMCDLNCVRLLRWWCSCTMSAILSMLICLSKTLPIPVQCIFQLVQQVQHLVVGEGVLVHWCEPGSWAHSPKWAWLPLQVTVFLINCFLPRP